MDLQEYRTGNREAEARHPWELARLEVITALMRQHLMGPSSRGYAFLDIGAGDLFLGRELCGRFPVARYIAVDTAFDEDASETEALTAGDARIRTFRSWQETMRSVDSSFDMVLLLDVLEHIEDEAAFLKSLRESSSVTGETLFLITAPAFQSLYSSHDLFLGHYRRYNNRILKELVCRAGLSAIDAGYFFFTLLPPRALRVLCENAGLPRRRQFRGVSGWRPHILRDFLLKEVLSLDFAASSLARKLGINPIGLSNYLICKKAA